MKWILPSNENGDLIETLFSSRGIKDKEKFLNPKFEDLSSPFDIFGIDSAVKTISEAIKKKKKIYIHGDFDVDGITATTIMWNFLYRDLNANVIPFIPNRFTDGYGLSEENIKNIISAGGNLLITVDCGVKDIELVNKYADKIDFIITDHHTLRKSDEEKVLGSKIIGDYLVSSKAKAVVHPQINKELVFKEICGAAVSWKVCSALNEYLKSGVDMKKYLDLVALGTVCDVMPLVDENRIFVKLGIDEMRFTKNVGLKTLMEISGVDIPTLTSYHLGYVIGPRLNASGRLGSAMDAVRLLTTNSQKYAIELASKLNELNKERQDLTIKYLDIAENLLLQNRDNKIHFIYGEEWPEGIVGLIAGRLTEKYNKPVLVGSLKDGVIKGSARSIPSFNIAENLKLLNSFLLKFGGHSQAAGFSLNQNSYLEFDSRLKEIAELSITSDDLERKLFIDMVVNERDLDIQVANSIQALEPFGASNLNPLFALLSSTINSGIKFIGKDSSHAKFYLGDNRAIECIFFNYKDKFNSLPSSTARKFDIAGNIELNSWNGNEKLVLKVKEMRESE